MSRFYRIASVTLGNGDDYEILSNGETNDYRNPAPTHLLVHPDGSVTGGSRLGVWKPIMDAAQGTEPAPEPGKDTDYQFEVKEPDYIHGTPDNASTIIFAAGHDNPTQVLSVRLENGRVYHYRDVPRSVYHALLSASSPGFFYNRNIKRNYTPITKDERLNEHSVYS